MQRRPFRPLTTLALVLPAALGLAGCASDSPADPNADSTTDPAAGATPDPTTGPSTDATEPPTDAAASISCPGLMANDVGFQVDLGFPGWGLKEQVAVTGGTFAIDPYAGTPEYEIDRGMSCSIYGENTEAGIMFDYIELPGGTDALAQELYDSRYEAMDENEFGATYHRNAEDQGVGHGFERFALLGDDWAIVGVSALDHDTNMAVFTGEFRDVDPNDYLSDEMGSLGCSMFLGEQKESAPETQVPILQSDSLSVLRGGDNALVTNRDYDSPNSDVYCEQITWHEGETAPADLGAPIASTPECEIYQRGERDYVADCGDAGYAEVAASDRTATQVRAPAFRGFDE